MHNPMGYQVTCLLLAVALLAVALLAVACDGGIPPAAPPSPTAATTCVPSTAGPFPATLRPDDVLLQFSWEGGFSRWESSVSLGRVPQFILLADGRAFYVEGNEPSNPNPAQTVLARLTPAEAQDLVQRVLNLGFECLESYTDRCWQSADGTGECVEDAATSVLRVRLPGGELCEIQNYADFSRDREALRAIRALLDDYRHPLAKPYAPEKATLFVQPVSEPSGITVLEWPLDPAWLVPPQAASTPWAAVLTGGDLAALVATTGLNMGDFWFRSEGQVFAVYLVPQIPGVDYGDMVTGFGEPLALRETPGAAPVPAR